MLRYFVSKLGLALLVALTVSSISFLLVFAAGDPAIAIAGENATAEDVQAVREFYGYDRPLVVQYGSWLWGVLHGDFGVSTYFNQPVSSLIGPRLAVTMTLGFLSIALALAISIPLGVLAAMRPNSALDRIALSIAVFGQAIPNFWMGLLLIMFFSIHLGILPASGTDSWKSFVMPMIVLGTSATPAIMRLTRTGMIEVLGSDYVRTARAKGLPQRKILFKHALRNAVIPVVSLAAVQLGFLLGGSVVVESVFALNGAGYAAWQSISRNDLPTMQALILIFSMFYIFFNLLADVLNAWLDPRLRGN
ncbi:ABC transporter permease [Seohaeicola nanhaiensis]|uniref:ABC transporter permease n=1 Tax=Seohaeicola nanhaiensis TaxID=1387282 RepID=A0ABV9KM29_9RHOB